MQDIKVVMTMDCEPDHGHQSSPGDWTCQLERRRGRSPRLRGNRGELRAARHLVCSSRSGRSAIRPISRAGRQRGMPRPAHASLEVLALAPPGAQIPCALRRAVGDRDSKRSWKNPSTFGPRAIGHTAALLSTRHILRQRRDFPGARAKDFVAVVPGPGPAHSRDAGDRTARNRNRTARTPSFAKHRCPRFRQHAAFGGLLTTVGRPFAGAACLPTSARRRLAGPSTM